MADIVKQVTYRTDARFNPGKCRAEAYGDAPPPTNTSLVVSALAIEGMLVEIDVIAVVK